MKKLKSRKFWLALLNAGFILLSEGLGWDISQETYLAITGPIMAYILGESWVDGRR